MLGLVGISIIAGFVLSPLLLLVWADAGHKRRETRQMIGALVFQLPGAVEERLSGKRSVIWLPGEPRVGIETVGGDNAVQATFIVERMLRPGAAFHETRKGEMAVFDTPPAPWPDGVNAVLARVFKTANRALARPDGTLAVVVPRGDVSLGGPQAAALAEDVRRLARELAVALPEQDRGEATAGLGAPSGAPMPLPFGGFGKED